MEKQVVPDFASPHKRNKQLFEQDSTEGIFEALPCPQRTRQTTYKGKRPGYTWTALHLIQARTAPRREIAPEYPVPLTEKENPGLTSRPVVLWVIFW